jgi:hypothetical protein
VHLLPESVRRPLRNLVDGVCPRRSANRKLHASEFQVFTVKYFISTTEHSGYCARATCCNVTEYCIFPTLCVDVFCIVLITYSHYFRNQHCSTFGVCNGDALHFVWEKYKFFEHSIEEFHLSSCRCSTLENIAYLGLNLVSLGLISIFLFTHL